MMIIKIQSNKVALQLEESKKVLNNSVQIENY
jgi:hypothetical protein